MVEWLTRRTSNLRIASRMGSNPVMVAVTSQDQSYYMKIECKHNKTAKKYFKALQEACSTSALSYWEE